MRALGPFCAALLLGIAAGVLPARAIEGLTAAGPIGGTDIRSALAPPPGVYGALIGIYAGAGEVKDGMGNPAPGLDAVDLAVIAGSALLAYVPDVKLFGGSIGFVGFLSAGQECGQLVSLIPSRCLSGFGDPYIEVDWARSFGSVRPPPAPGAFPIVEGLSLDFGLGAVIPVGKYDAGLQVMNGITLGNNTFDLAPSVAFTYTTGPLIADGTEFSSRIYLNNYGTNPITNYHAGSLVDIDFAVSEHIGRFQVGPAGVFLRQIADDHQFGAIVAPDGRKIEYLSIGGVANYDLAEIGATIKVKAVSTVLAENCGVSKIVVVTFAKKLY